MSIKIHLENRENRDTLYIYSLVMIIASSTLWTIYKVMYPNPNMTLDSYYYVDAALWKANVHAWPIGYSWIIRIIGILSRSANFLITVQYFFLQFSLLIFFLSVKYLFALTNPFSICLFVILIINPIYINISNFIISDAFFTALSILWITNLIWLIMSPHKYQIILNGILLLLAFIIRYNALYYPIIGSIAIIISSIKIKMKIIGILFQLLLVILFIGFTTREMNKEYGVKQFSPFGSWKQANNSLYMYEHVYLKNNGTIPTKFQALDKTVKSYFNNPHTRVNLFDSDFSSGSYYMFKTWGLKSPLVKYMDDTYGPDDGLINYVKSSKLGPLYKDYGNYLINKYPLESIQYIIIPNSLRYMLPLQEVLTSTESPYELKRDSLGVAAVRWFGFISLEAPKYAVNLRVSIFKHFPWYHLFVNLSFWLIALRYLISKLPKALTTQQNKLIILIVLLCVTNFLFSITVGSSLLRYQIFIITIESSFLIILLQLIYQNRKSNITIHHRKVNQLQ